MSDPGPAPTDLPDAARRIAAYGAITRMTGFDYLVELDGAELVVNDGDERLSLHRDDGDLSGIVTADWASDSAAERVATEWIEDYVEQTQQFLVIRRHYIADLIADPFSEIHLERLADRFPNADIPAIEEFLSDVRAWLPDPPSATVAPEGARVPFTVESGGLTLTGDHWRPTGRADGRSPLLFLHGGGQTRHSWDRSAADLAARGREVYTLDLRGHGDSSWAADGDYELDAFTDDLLAVLRTLQITPVLVGASLGGITALNTVGRNPGIATALVMVDVVIHTEERGIDRIRAFMAAHQGGFATLDDVADAIVEYYPERRRTRNLDGLQKNVRQRADGRWYWHWDPRFLGDPSESHRATRPEILAEAAVDVTVPTLLVRGGRSDVVSDEGIARTLALIPHAQVADVAGAGHMVAGDDNQVFETAVVEFLDRHGL
ncbi:alpha/beta fold hydrolase [Gordonia iterans]